jgi:anti-sigma factor (TIGR02949 family)
MMANHTECKHLLASLSEYVDGTLSEDLCAEIERHLEGCDNCKVVVNTLRKTVDLYHQCSEDEGLPDSVRQRLYMRLNLEDYLH